MLTILVTDIRRSSRVLNPADPVVATRFYRAFIGMTVRALGRAGAAGECRVHQFLGDGCSVFFHEPDPRAPWKVGPVRAVMAALRMQRLFDELCAQRRFVDTKLGFDTLGLAAAIHYGSVIYGPVGLSAIRENIGTGRQVVFTFRLLEHAQASEVLVSAEVRQALHGQQLRLEPVVPDPDLKDFGPQNAWRVRRAGATRHGA
jgi:class 3 adenylate cyclase